MLSHQYLYNHRQITQNTLTTYALLWGETTKSSVSVSPCCCSSSCTPRHVRSFCFHAQTKMLNMSFICASCMQNGESEDRTRQDTHGENTTYTLAHRDIPHTYTYACSCTSSARAAVFWCLAVLGRACSCPCAPQSVAAALPLSLPLLVSSCTWMYMCI